MLLLEQSKTSNFLFSLIYSLFSLFFWHINILSFSTLFRLIFFRLFLFTFMYLNSVNLLKLIFPLSPFLYQFISRSLPVFLLHLYCLLLSKFVLTFAPLFLWIVIMLWIAFTSLLSFDCAYIFFDVAVNIQNNIINENIIVIGAFFSFPFFISFLLLLNCL